MNFWELVGVFSEFLWWKISYFRILKIIRIVGNFQNYDIISCLLMCEFLKICWDIFKNFSVENLFYWIIGNVEIVEIIEKFWNYGIHLHHGCVKKGQKL